MNDGVIAIVGAGRMGRGIALSCALASRQVVLVDLKSRATDGFEALETSVRTDIERDLAFLTDLQLVSAKRAVEVASFITTRAASDVEQLADECGLIFEAVPETLEAKREAFAWISRCVAPNAMVASTTSTLNVDELAAMVSGPGRFLNAHWLNPAHLMPLVEIAVGKATDTATTSRMRAILASLGKVPVVCSASPGYIVPRIQALAMNEAARLVEEGVASAEDVDTAIRTGFGLRYAVLGLLEFIDWGGNDILYYASGHLSRTVDAERYRVPGIVEKNMLDGRNGLRDGEGFYDYAGIDAEAYRRDRLERFVRLVGFLGLLPPGLAAADDHSNLLTTRYSAIRMPKAK